MSERHSGGRPRGASALADCYAFALQRLAGDRDDREARALLDHAAKYIGKLPSEVRRDVEKAQAAVTPRPNLVKARELQKRLRP